MTIQIDDRAVPIDQGTLESILKRIKGVNDLWEAQQTELTYLDFPDKFRVREMHGDLLGYIVWDGEIEWTFQPVTHDEQDRDRRGRVKNEPIPEAPLF